MYFYDYISLISSQNEEYFSQNS